MRLSLAVRVQVGFVYWGDSCSLCVVSVSVLINRIFLRQQILGNLHALTSKGTLIGME